MQGLGSCTLDHRASPHWALCIAARCFLAEHQLACSWCLATLVELPTGGLLTNRMSKLCSRWAWGTSHVVPCMFPSAQSLSRTQFCCYLSLVAPCHVLRTGGHLTIMRPFASCPVALPGVNVTVRCMVGELTHQEMTMNQFFRQPDALTYNGKVTTCSKCLTILHAHCNRPLIAKERMCTALQVDRDLRKMLVKPDAPEPTTIAVRVWPQAIPQFNTGHLEAVEVRLCSTALQAPWCMALCMCCDVNWSSMIVMVSITEV